MHILWNIEVKVKKKKQVVCSCIYFRWRLYIQWTRLVLCLSSVWRTRVTQRTTSSSMQPTEDRISAGETAAVSVELPSALTLGRIAMVVDRGWARSIVYIDTHFDAFWGTVSHAVSSLATQSPIIIIAVINDSCGQTCQE